VITTPDGYTDARLESRYLAFGWPATFTILSMQIRFAMKEQETKKQFGKFDLGILMVLGIDVASAQSGHIIIV